MKQEINLSELIDKNLPAEMTEVLNTAALAADEQGQKLYLVGGMVRDLLLGRENLDLDLVVEGDAAALAYRLADIVRGKVTVHSRFLTAKVRWDGRSVDLATARSETYSSPGTLPSVKPGLIETDLFRRDFTINSMAIDLSKENQGRLIDPFNGRDDIKKGLIRILHDRSFIDDATRIWRALRYEQRLDFRLEPDTLRLLKQNMDMLDTISTDRIHHELELVLKEDKPEKVICRASELGVLQKLHPTLKGDSWLSEKFREVREAEMPDKPTVELYLAILVFRLNEKEIEEFISGLSLRRLETRTLEDICLLKQKLDKLSEPEITPGIIYQYLYDLSRSALIAVSLAADSGQTKDNIELYLNRMRHVKPILTGADLRQMDIPQGPRIKEILHHLLIARLDGKISSKQDELEMVKKALIQQL
jgi:tRNA nucleotidyltransferase (CCA-adding enzyme)